MKWLSWCRRTSKRLNRMASNKMGIIYIYFICAHTCSLRYRSTIFMGSLLPANGNYFILLFILVWSPAHFYGSFSIFISIFSVLLLLLRFNEILIYSASAIDNLFFFLCLSLLTETPTDAIHTHAHSFRNQEMCGKNECEKYWMRSIRTSQRINI